MQKSFFEIFRKFGHAPAKLFRQPGFMLFETAAVAAAAKYKPS